MPWFTCCSVEPVARNRRKGRALQQHKPDTARILFRGCGEGSCCQSLSKSLLLCVVETSLEKNLLNTLVELDAAVKAMPSANPKPDLIPLFTRIDQLAKKLPRDADPVLLHYLQKKSYEKARLFLQGRDLENQIGNCRHV
jgi:hypothetical protein